MIAAMFIGGLVAGCLCGLVPFFVGRQKGQRNLGLMGLVACTLGGMILGVLLSIPLAIVFTVVIRNKARASNSTASIAAGVHPLAVGGRICPQCSAQLSLDAHLCGNCGHQFS